MSPTILLLCGLGVSDALAVHLRERGFVLAVPEPHERWIDALARVGADAVVLGISEAALQVLERHRWPGNIRELRNVVERTVILLQGDIIQPADLPPEVRGRGRSRPARGGATDLIELPDEGVDLEEVERSLVVQALERVHGSRTGAAHLLGITRFAVLARVRKYGLENVGRLRVGEEA
jgi:two-component system NtrC family response regulator